MSSIRRIMTSKQGQFDISVLDDPRWEQLVSGEITAEDLAELESWAKQSPEAAAALQAFQPVDEEAATKLTNLALASLASNAAPPHDAQTLTLPEGVNNKVAEMAKKIARLSDSLSSKKSTISDQIELKMTTNHLNMNNLPPKR